MSAPATAEEVLERTERMLLLCRYLEKDVYPPFDSVISLASQLRNLSALKNCEVEPELLPFYCDAVWRLRRQIDAACAGDDPSGNDHTFLRNLSDAKELAASGEELSQGLDVTGSAVYAFALLRGEHPKGRIGRNEIQKQVEQWRTEGGYQRVSDRHWNRVFKQIDELLRFG